MPVTPSDQTINPDDLATGWMVLFDDAPADGVVWRRARDEMKNLYAFLNDTDKKLACLDRLLDGVEDATTAEWAAAEALKLPVDAEECIPVFNILGLVADAQANGLLNVKILPQIDKILDTYFAPKLRHEVSTKIVDGEALSVTAGDLLAMRLIKTHTRLNDLTLVVYTLGGLIENEFLGQDMHTQARMTLFGLLTGGETLTETAG